MMVMAMTVKMTTVVRWLMMTMMRVVIVFHVL